MTEEDVHRVDLAPEVAVVLAIITPGQVAEAGRHVGPFERTQMYKKITNKRSLFELNEVSNWNMGMNQSGPLYPQNTLASLWKQVKPCSNHIPTNTKLAPLMIQPRPNADSTAATFQNIG